MRPLKLEVVDMSQPIVILIEDYLRATESCVQETQRFFEVPNLLRARRENRIPAQGSIEGKARFKFSFHGVGCSFASDQFSVDVDFDECGACAGFDAWRLWQFAKSQPGRYGQLENQDIIRRNLVALETAGRVVRTGKLPNPEMLLLKR